MFHIYILLFSSTIGPLSTLLSDEPVTGPQWDQWKEDQGLVSVSPTSIDVALESENPLINAPVVIGNNPLCKQTPDSGDIYAHVSCILTYILYVTVIASICVYLWKKWINRHHPRVHSPEGNGIDFDLLTETLKANGFPSNRKSPRGKPGDTTMV